MGVLSGLHGLRPFDKSLSRSPLLVAGCVSALLVAEACCGIAQAFPSVGSSAVKGTFDNAAGFAASLCAGFPFCLYGFSSFRGKGRYAFAGAGVVLAAGVLLSASRAGMLSLLAVAVAWLWQRLRLSARVKWTAVLLLFVSASCTLYFAKKDSADGRLLIWRCAWEMLADKPLLGWGIGGFEAHYMDYQAAYFERHPDSRYSLLADTVQYPFSEYLNIGIAFGVAGLLVVGALFACLLRCYLHSPTPEKESGLLCWLGIAVFAAFSYPLMYPFVWLMLAYAACLLLKDAVHVPVPQGVRRAGAACLLALCIGTGVRVSQRVEAELLWGEAVNAPAAENDNSLLEKYRRAYAVLKSDRYFLYNYAAALSRCGKHSESLAMARECRAVWADYDLELMLAELCRQHGDPMQAESHYRCAVSMCPSRFIPLFQLVFLLDEAGRCPEAVALARQIVDKR